MFSDAHVAMFMIRDGVKDFDLDRSMLDVYIEHKIHHFDHEHDNYENITTTRYEVRRCDEDDFHMLHEEGHDLA